MPWMTMWRGGSPVYLAAARGARVTDVDGNEYADFCLGDTGAMAGHSPEPAMAALRERAGITVMLPTDDAEWVGSELARRFGVPYWQFSLTATDANRWVLRMMRQITGRPRVLVFNWCYHGSVDEAFVTLDADGRERSREGNVGPMVDPAETTRVAEFNELEHGRGGARARRRRLRADGAGAHEHRHRAARARLPRGRARGVHARRARCS